MTAKAIAAIEQVANEARRVRKERHEFLVNAIERVATVAKARLRPLINELRTELRQRIDDYEHVGVTPSLLRVMGLSGKEVPLNRVLEWIMNPDSEHGAGRAVLLEVAHGLHFGPLAGEIREGSAIEVRGEQAWPPEAASNREPDLLIIAPNAALLIENKVASPESGEGQYADYLSALRRYAAACALRHQQIWLSAPEKRPVPEDWDGSFTHAQLASWIRRAAESNVSAWGRIACLLVVEQLNNAGDRNAALHRARVLLEATQDAPPRARNAKLLRQSLTDVGRPMRPWGDNK